MKEKTFPPKTKIDLRSVLHILVVFLTLMVIAIMNLVQIGSQQHSSTENRSLTTLPSFSYPKLLDGSFTDQMDDFFSDQFLIREDLLAFARTIESFRGLPGEGVMELVSLGTGRSGTEEGLEGSSLPQIPLYSQSVESEIRGIRAEINALRADKPASSLDGLPEAPNLQGEDPDLDLGNRVINEILILDDYAMEVPGYSELTVRYYASAIEEFSNQIPVEIPISLMLGPSRFILEQDPQILSLAPDLEESLLKVYEKLPSRVRSINPVGVLRASRDQYIYFRTDHHWTALGAYYAYRLFAIQTRRSPVDLGQYQETVLDDFVGTLYSMTLSEKILKTPDNLIVFEPFVEHTFRTYWSSQGKDDRIINTDNPGYLVFLSSDNPLSIAKTAIENEEKLLVVKDSYGNALVPFLLPHFQEIHVVDPRYFQQNIIEYLEEEGITEVFLLNSYAVLAEARGYARNLIRVVNYQEESLEESPRLPDEDRT